MADSEKSENGCFKLFIGFTVVFIIFFIAMTGLDGVAVLGNSIFKLITGVILMLIVLWLITKAIG